jgi:hypothetical protein
MRRRLVLPLIALLIAANSFAVQPQFWRIRSAEDFLSGEIEGLAVTSRGELRPAPAMRKLATFTDPFVLSQASGDNGDRFFGTGNEGKIYRLRGTELKLIHTAPEAEIYALAYRDGALYAGTSPNGKVYRIDPNDGKATPFYEPKQAYIWALEFSGSDLLVATGVEGQLFRVGANGTGKLIFDSPETHLRSLAVRRDGSLLAGSSSKGRIYEVNKEGNAHALFDSQLNEISSIYVDANGIGWAAGVSNTLPSSAPKPAQGGAKSAQQSSGAASSTEPKKEGETATANVEVSFSFDDSSSSPSYSSAGSGELYRIDTDGFVEIVRKFEREMVYAIDAGRDGSILLSTGPTGRIYEVRDGEAALIGSVPEKQIVSISTEGNQTLITTTNSGAVYRMESAPATNGEFRSAAKDVERFSRFGHYRIDGNNVGNSNVAISFRTGNTRTPDATWSVWSVPQTTTEGGIDAPAGRYIQWKLTTPKRVPDLVVDNVTIAFMNRNVAPNIESVAVQDPAVVYISSAYPASPQVVEATNPDEYGIFSSLDTPRDRQGNDPGKRVFRKGYRTISWRARDDNNDSLRYAVSFRQKGSDKWLRLRENLEETQINFDTSQLPDGTYQIRLTASDVTDNPDVPLTDVKEGIEFQVDNSSPAIGVTPNGSDVVVRVTDKLSAVGRVEYSVDAQKWQRLTPVDGIADSSDESYRLPRNGVVGKYVIVRAVDAYFNVATESITLP